MKLSLPPVRPLARSIVLASIAALVAASVATTTACAPVTPEAEGDPAEDSGPAVDVALTGTVIVRVLDDGKDTDTRIELRDERGQRYTLTFDTAPRLNPGDIIEVTGELRGESSVTVASTHVKTPAAPRADGPAIRSPIEHRVAVVALNGARITEKEARDVLERDKKESVNDLMRASSNGIESFSLALFRRYALAYSAADCRYARAGQLADAVVAALAADGPEPASFDHIVVVVPEKCGDDWKGFWSELGAIRGDGDLAFARLSMFEDKKFKVWELAHALGHNLGLDDAASVTCPGSSSDPDGDGCTIDELGNHNDVMGSGEGVYFSMPYRRYLGWVTPGQVVTAAGDGEFNLRAADHDSCGILGLRIPVPGAPGAYYYLEYRRAREGSPYAGTGKFGDLRSHAVLVSRSVDGGASLASAARIELGTERYQGLALDQRHDLGAGVSVTLKEIGGLAAKVEVKAPGTGFPTDDAGDGAYVAADGSYGRAACEGDPVDECPDDPTKDAPGECGCGVPEGTCTPTPTISVSKSTYAIGEDIVVNFSDLPGNFYDWVGLFRPGAANDAYQTFIYTQGTTSGTMVFRGRSIAGSYEARLFFDDSYSLEQTVSFTVE